MRGMSLFNYLGISNAAHNGETYEGIELNAFEGKAKLIFDLMVADEKWQMAFLEPRPENIL